MKFIGPVIPQFYYMRYVLNNSQNDKEAKITQRQGPIVIIALYIQR